MTSDVSVTLNSGQKMAIVGFGTSGAKTDVMRRALGSALECGYRSIDTAYIYCNEDAIGEELHDWLQQGRLQREDVFVTTKLPNTGNRRSDVSHFLKISLKNLQLDYVDLYLIHHPFGMKSEKDIDFDTNLEELWRGMEEQVEAGRTKAIGLSNFSASQIEWILKIAKIRPAVNQIEVHCYLQQRSLVQTCQTLGIAVVAFSPLGAPNRGSGETQLLEHPTVLAISKKHSRTTGQILLRFLVQQNIIVIPKSVTPARIKSNFQLLDFSLSEEEMRSLASLDKGEDGRIFPFTREYPGIEKHKEYPFRERYA